MKSLKPILLIGDAVAITAFATLGRAEHQTGLAPLAILATALPFLAAWFGVGLWLGTFRPEAIDHPVAALKKAAFTWLLAWPIALQLRVLLTGRSIPFSFAAVVFSVNLLFLGGWRLLYSWSNRRRGPGLA